MKKGIKIIITVVFGFSSTSRHVACDMCTDYCFSHS